MLVREVKKPCCFWEIPKKENERKHGNMCQHEFSFSERKVADAIHQCQRPPSSGVVFLLSEAGCFTALAVKLGFKRHNLRADRVRSWAENITHTRTNFADFLRPASESGTCLYLQGLELLNISVYGSETIHHIFPDIFCDPCVEKQTLREEDCESKQFVLTFQ